MPIFANKRIRFDENSIFFDARRKAVEEDDASSPSDIVTITLYGLCAEFRKPLVKCDKCMKKDQQLIMSKRKGETKKWNEEDTVNNQRLLQVTFLLSSISFF